MDASFGRWLSGIQCFPLTCYVFAKQESVPQGFDHRPQSVSMGGCPNASLSWTWSPFSGTLAPVRRRLFIRHFFSSPPHSLPPLPQSHRGHLGVETRVQSHRHGLPLEISIQSQIPPR